VDILNKILYIQDQDRSPKFNFYNFSENKIRENIIQRRSYSFVIGYEILKHFKNQKQNKELRKNKKSFNDQTLKSFNKHQNSSSKSKNEEEVKSAKDYDSKHLSNSAATIDQIDIASIRRKSNIKVFKNSSFLAPKREKKSKYLKMLHFSNLKNLGSKLEELKELHKNYFLINYYNSSTVIIF
jgi:hypothetical protein